MTKSHRASFKLLNGGITLTGCLSVLMIMILLPAHLPGQTNTFPSTGNVGIGLTGSPQYPLDVAGAIHTTGTIVLGSGQTLGQSVTFTPAATPIGTTTGEWYRILTGPQTMGGVVRINGWMDNTYNDVEVQFNVGGYTTDPGAASIVETRFSAYNGGNVMAVDQVRACSDGGSSVYFDIHISHAWVPAPITVSVDGPDIFPPNPLYSWGLMSIPAPVPGPPAGTNVTLTLGPGLVSTGRFTTQPITINPTGTGWYRVISIPNYGGGTVRVWGSIDGTITDVEVQSNAVGWGGSGSIQQTRYANYGVGAVDQVRVSSDGGGTAAFDVHVPPFTHAAPIYVSFDGPVLSRSYVVQNPVIGALAGGYSSQTLTLGLGFRSTAGGTLAESGGNVGIGTSNPVHKLQVAGTIGAEEIIVSSTGADYVFEPGYKLQPLQDVADFVSANHHLPGIPSAQEMKDSGVSLGEVQTKLLAKIEELTLHMIRADAQIQQLQEDNQELRSHLERQN